MSDSAFGRYELVSRLAIGGMSDVYLARVRGEGGFERDVVIKRLFPHLIEHPQAERMFVDEARLLSMLAHPSIPQVYDLGRDEQTWFMAMEFVDGVDLASIAHVHDGQPLPLPIAIEIVMQVAEALHHAHERTDGNGQPLRIVHRDVTPQNILLTRDGIAKLIDFGIARTSLRQETEPGVVRGTFSYMSPEQVRGRALDKRSDVFALGIVLWELTTGERLFSGTDVSIMTRIVEHDAPPPSDFVEGYPPELDAIVLSALRRNRAERMPSCAHFAGLLDEFSRKHHLGVGSRPLARFTKEVWLRLRAILDEGVVLHERQSPKALHAQLEEERFEDAQLEPIPLRSIVAPAKKSVESQDVSGVHGGTDTPVGVDDSEGV